MTGWRAALERRHGWMAAVVLGGAALLGVMLAPHLPVLLWNATASAPLGFYRLSAVGAPQVGEWVALKPPRPLATWITAGGYAPPNVPLLKEVAAVAGQAICRQDDAILIDGQVAAMARSNDRQGAPLPVWRGCRRLGTDEVFLLNRPTDSLDGRYFGASQTKDLIGRAEPLWTWGRAP